MNSRALVQSPCRCGRAASLVAIKDGRVRQTNFSDYRVPPMSDIPHFEVRVVSTDNPPTGVGENGVPVVGGAAGNAMAALTGARLRELAPSVT